MFDFGSEDIDFNHLLDDLSSVSGTTTSEDTSSIDGEYTFSQGPQQCSGRKRASGPKKPRRNRYDPSPSPDMRAMTVSKPTMLKTDIRRSYPMMMANAFNSGDFKMLFGFLDTFFVPNFEQVVLKMSPLTQEPYQVIKSGLQTVAPMWYSMTQLNPDPVVSVKDTRIHMISNSPNTQIVTTYGFKVTSLYDESSADSNDLVHCVGKDEESVVPSSQLPVVGTKRRDEASEKADFIQQIEETVEGMKQHLVLRKEPLIVDTTGTLIFHTNENKFITRIEMDMSAIPKPPGAMQWAGAAKC